MVGFALFLTGSIQAEVKLGLIELPPGFSIEIYAEGVKNARQMTRGDKGTIFAGSRRAGKVWAISDVDGDQRADKFMLARWAGFYVLTILRKTLISRHSRWS